MTDKKYDAHLSADIHENTFTLQGSDPYSPSIISLWATVMLGDITVLDAAYEKIRATLKRQINTGNSFGDVQMSRGKHLQAYKLAMHMRANDDKIQSDITYDAHESAKSDEKTFTLQSGDPYCADMAELWAALITGNENETELRFQQINKTFMQEAKLKHKFGKKQQIKGKITMAYQLEAFLLNEQSSTV